MNRVGSVKGHEQFRMVDFVQWGIAIAGPLGFSSEEFLSAYKQSIEYKWEDTAEENSLIQKLVYLVESNMGEWVGSSVDLLQKLKLEGGKIDKTIPDDPQSLGREILRIAPVMRKTSHIEITKGEKREPGTGRNIYVLKKIRQESELCVRSDEQEKIPHSLWME